jgi:hypothetical protein
MKKRHVTELTGQELQAAFKAAVHEVWNDAAMKGQPVYGTDSNSHAIIRQPDGSLYVFKGGSTRRTASSKSKSA